MYAVKACKEIRADTHYSQCIYKEREAADDGLFGFMNWCLQLMQNKLIHARVTI